MKDLKNFGLPTEPKNPTFTEKFAYPKEGIITNATLVNLRNEPNANDPKNVLAVISKGCKVIVKGAENKGFYPVKYEAIDGYVMAKYVEVK